MEVKTRGKGTKNEKKLRNGLNEKETRLLKGILLLNLKNFSP